MIETITLVLTNDDGEILPVKPKDIKPDVLIEIETADLFTEICKLNNSIEDAQIKTAEKFHFALSLKNYVEDIKRNAER